MKLFGEYTLLVLNRTIILPLLLSLLGLNSYSSLHGPGPRPAKDPGTATGRVAGRVIFEGSVPGIDTA